MILDAMVKASGTFFSDTRYGATCLIKFKGRQFLLLKPSTYMNLSGNAVDYWLKKEKIPLENLLVIVDDLSLPTGSIRLKPKGSAGGHNGLTHINYILGTDNYSRIRIGIGSDFKRGGQVDYVLGSCTPEEKKIIAEKTEIIIEMIKSFGTIGLELTMTSFNKFGKPPKEIKEGSDPDTLNKLLS